MVTVLQRERQGRPRDPGRERLILDAARDLFARRGFTGTSMDEIARTAGVGKDTLYRRFDSKEELAGRLLEVMAESAIKPAEVDGDPSIDLLLYLQDVVRLNLRTDFSGIVAAIVGAASRNARLADQFAAFWAERRKMSSVLVRRILGAHATDAEVERALDQVLGPIYYRLLLSHAPITDEYLWELVVTISTPPRKLEAKTHE